MRLLQKGKTILKHVRRKKEGVEKNKPGFCKVVVLVFKIDEAVDEEVRDALFFFVWLEQ